jgi:hypothetical protein
LIDEGADVNIFNSNKCSGNMQISSVNGKTTINGKTYSGSNISVRNGRVIVDGKEVDKIAVGQDVRVSVSGSVDSISLENGTIECVSAKDIQTTNGDIKIAGSVDGDVTCKNGNISCGNVSGSVTNKNGNIKHN